MTLAGICCGLLIYPCTAGEPPNVFLHCRSHFYSSCNAQAYHLLTRTHAHVPDATPVHGQMQLSKSIYGMHGKIVQRNNMSTSMQANNEVG